MKKTLLSFLLIVLFCPLFAQQISFELSTFYYFTPNQSKYYSNPVEHNIILQQLKYDENPGIALNAFYNSTLINKNDLSIGMGINWFSYKLSYIEQNITQGTLSNAISSSSFIKEFSAINPQSKTSLIWLNIPIVYHYEIINNLNVNGGLQISALLYNKQEFTFYSLENNTLLISSKRYDKGISKFVFGLQFGGEYRVIKELGVTLQYYFSLTPLYDKAYKFIDNSRMQGIVIGVKYYL